MDSHASSANDNGSRRLCGLKQDFLPLRRPIRWFA